MNEDEKEKGLLRAQFEEALQRNKSLEERLSTIKEELREAVEKIRLSKRKQTEGNYYRSVLHQLRSHWYLRPFIPRHILEAPAEDLGDCWHYRGPRFHPPSPHTDVGSRRRHRVLVVGHLLGRKLFGSENSLLDMISVIDGELFDVFVVFPERNDDVFEKLQPYVQGIAVFKYSWWHKSRLFDEEAVSKFERICREQQIDLLHVNTITLSDPLLAARRLNIPAITNAREVISLDESLADRLGTSPAEIVKMICENATYILANSATTLADYPCADRGGYLYNFVDARAFDFPNAVDPNAIKVGLVSNNVLKKGISDFLEIARETAELVPELQFYLVGPENNLIEEWRTAGLFPPNFHVRDYVSQPTDVYRDLNIVLNLSHCAESFGRTVAEAMAARRPVVAYRYGALPELIEDGKTGFLVPYLDLSAVLNRLRFFVKHPEKVSTYGEAGRQRIAQLCSPDAMKNSLNALYEQLVANTERARS